MSSSSFYNLSNPSVSAVINLNDQLALINTQLATVLSNISTAQATLVAVQNAANQVLIETPIIKTDNATLQLTDAGKLIILNKSTAITLTVPPNSSVAFPVGTWVNVTQAGTGQASMVAGSGVTINTALGLSLRAQNSGGSLIKTAADTWLFVGDLNT